MNKILKIIISITILASTRSVELTKEQRCKTCKKWEPFRALKRERSINPYFQMAKTIFREEKHKSDKPKKINPEPNID